VSISPDKLKKLAEKHGYLDYMLIRYLEMFGEDDLIPFLQGNEIPPLPTIRANTLKISPRDLQERLQKKGFILMSIPDIPEGFFIEKSPFSLGATTEYLMGYYYIQSRASMLAGLLLNPSSTDVVIDACAAPGGKTSHLAQIMSNEGILIACELRKNRLITLRSNLSRCGVKNCLCFLQDARSLHELGITPDKILLDVPCTGEGLICIQASRKRSRELEDIEKMSQIQKDILIATIQTVKKGGEILYSTCSIAPEENEFVIQEALEKGNVEITNLDLNGGSPGFTDIFNRSLSPSLVKTRRFYPFKDNTEGFFICKLRKIEEV